MYRNFICGNSLASNKDFVENFKGHTPATLNSLEQENILDNQCKSVYLKCVKICYWLLWRLGEKFTAQQSSLRKKKLQLVEENTDSGHGNHHDTMKINLN